MRYPVLVNGKFESVEAASIFEAIAAAGGPSIFRVHFSSGQYATVTADSVFEAVACAITQPTLRSKIVTLIEPATNDVVVHRTGSALAAAMVDRSEWEAYMTSGDSAAAVAS